MNAAVRSAWCVVRNWKTGTYDDYQVHLMGEQRDQTQCLVENHVHRTPHPALRFLGLCYAHLYLGLFHEVLGLTEQAREHLCKAAINFKMPHYMGRTAQVHVLLRGWDKKTESTNSP